MSGHGEICPFRQKSEPAEFLANHDSAFLFNNRLQTFKGERYTYKRKKLILGATNLPRVTVNGLDMAVVAQIKDYFGSAFSQVSDLKTDKK